MRDSFGEIDGQIPKIVLLDMSEHQDLCDQVKLAIPSTKYMRGSSKNNIVQNALSMDVDAMLWEFNESTITDNDIDHFADIMLKYIKTYKSNDNSGFYNFQLRLWFCIGLIVVIFLIWIFISCEKMTSNTCAKSNKSWLYIDYKVI